MFYVCEFEFLEDGDSVVALCMNEWGGATSGDDLGDAVECAADWLSMMVDDALIHGKKLPPLTLGHEPQHGGQVIAVAVVRELSDIKTMTAADAARVLGVSSARVSQLINAGLLESWVDGTKRLVTVDSVNARLEEKPRAGRPKAAATK